MYRSIWTRTVSLLLALSLAGCGSQNSSSSSFVSESRDAVQADANINEQEDSDYTSITTTITEQAVTAPPVSTSTVTTTVDEAALKEAEEEQKRAEEEEERKKVEEEKKLAEQRNSFSMMYYLAITAEEIRSSKDNRLVLEEIRTSLLNDINPGAVDEITQGHLKTLRDTIDALRSIDIKRERLRFIHNQEKATAIRNAVPNPLAVISVSNTIDWKKLALTVSYTAVDSFNNYKRSVEGADLSYIMSGWELDDEEEKIIMKNRDRAFDYMVNMVREYDLDGLKTLNEEAIERFAQICTAKNAAEKIRLLKEEDSTYYLLGNYWLELADAYFETSQYQKCLDCVDRYNELSIGIYRQDYNYLHILPKAIVAAQETYSGNQYETVLSKFADDIENNTSRTSPEDWSTRYFAAQVYIDLYSKTNKRAYLEKAYDIALNNVTCLIGNQRSLNKTYLDDVVEQEFEEPDYKFMTDDQKKEAKAEKKRVKEYNKALKEARKTELPSLYEPLVVNCELLFSLADKLKINKEQKTEIEAILTPDTNDTFLVYPIKDAYSFYHKDNRYSISMDDKEIIIPAYLLTSDTFIKVDVTDNGSTKSFYDCAVTEVERKGTDISDYKAHVSSEKLKKYKWTADSKITITLRYNDAYNKNITFNFIVSQFEEHKFKKDKVVFSEQ